MLSHLSLLYHAVSLSSGQWPERQKSPPSRIQVLLWLGRNAFCDCGLRQTSNKSQHQQGLTAVGSSGLGLNLRTRWCPNLFA